MFPFLCYHFPLYILFCVIIYVIIYCYHDIYIMKNYNILYNQKNDIKEFKNDSIYTIKIITSPTLENDNIQALKMITFITWKMITSSTLENDNIQAFKNENIYTWKMIISATLETDNIWTFKNDNIYTPLDVMIFKCRGCYYFSSCKCYNFWRPGCYCFRV